MLSSRRLDHVFVSRVSQTRDNIRGVKGSMLSSRLFRVSKTRDNKRGVNTYIVSGLNHTGNEHMI
jgi:hypothetical protein